jgi:hypothetical protein
MDSMKQISVIKAGPGSGAKNSGSASNKKVQILFKGTVS